MNVVVDKVLMAAVEAAVAVATVAVLVEVQEEIILLLHHLPLQSVVVRIGLLKIIIQMQIITMDHVCIHDVVVWI